MSLKPPKAKQIGGVWLPEEEEHLVEWMTTSKRSEIRDGKLTYQIHKLDRVMQHVPTEQRRTVIDIGAHVGLWSMWLAPQFERLIAFEPVKAHYDIYPFNVEAINVFMHTVALGNTFGRVTMGNTPGESTGNTHVVELDEQDYVDMYPLDHFKLRQVDLIKIDTEGFEKKIIEGGEETIKDNRPVIVVEQKGYEKTYFGGERNEAVTLLQSWGMRVAEAISGDFIMVWD